MKDLPVDVRIRDVWWVRWLGRIAGIALARAEKSFWWALGLVVVWKLLALSGGLRLIMWGARVRPKEAS